MTINVNEQIKIYNEAVADSVITNEEKVKLEKAGITDELIKELSGKNQDETADIINKYFNSEPQIDSTPWYKKAWNATKETIVTATGTIAGVVVGSKMNKPLKYMMMFGLFGVVGGLLVSKVAFRNNKEVEKPTQENQPEALSNKDLEQKNMINSIMNTEGNCWNTDKNDLEKISNKIIKYANANNPRAELERYANESKSERVKALAQQMLDEGFADNFAVFAASIIAKESKFLEESTLLHNINSSNGKGIFQITSILVEDFWNNHIAKKCIDPELKNKYKNSKELFEALQEDPEINYQVGIAGLNYKLFYTLDKLEREKKWNIPGGKNTPTTLLEYTAYKYNGNSKLESKAADKKDRKFEVRDNYARDVINTFCKATAEQLNNTEYFVCTGYKHDTKNPKKRIRGYYKLVTPEQN